MGLSVIAEVISNFIMPRSRFAIRCFSSPVSIAAIGEMGWGRVLAVKKRALLNTGLFIYIAYIDVN